MERYKDGMDALTNYEFGTTTEGNSHVDKAKLNIKFNDVNRTYGNANLKDGEKYDFTTSGWVNGDNDKELHKQLHLGDIKDGALANDPNRTTNDAGGNYTWSGTINGKDSLTNYDIVSQTAGKSNVDKAKLSISADDETIIKGDTPTYTGKHDGLANGDTWEGIGGGKFAIADNGMENQTGSHDKKIGVWIDGKFYAQDTDTFKNYDIKINPGTLIVKDKPNPDKPNPDKPNPDKPNPDKPNPDNPNPDNPNPDKPNPDNPNPDKPDTQLNKYYHDEWDKDYTDRERRAVFNFIDEGTDVGQDLETDSEETDTKDENKDAQ